MIAFTLVNTTAGAAREVTLELAPDALAGFGGMNREQAGDIATGASFILNTQLYLAKEMASFPMQVSWLDAAGNRKAATIIVRDESEAFK
jgi:hypothetical protein